MLADITSCNEE